MKNLLIGLFLFITFTAKSQSEDGIQRNMSKFGYYAGFHVLDDDDIPFQDLIDPKTLNWSPYPSKIGVLYPVADFFMAEGSVSYLKLRNNSAKKYVAPYNCWGIDFNLQNHYYFYKKSDYEEFGISSNRKRILGSIYPTIGISANIKNQYFEDLHFNMNIGGGGNWWVIQNKLAINGQAMAQIGLAGTIFQGNANQLRYSLGVIYKK